MSIDMAEFEHEFKEMQSKVDTIYKYIVGHEDLEQKGLIHWKNEADIRIGKLEKIVDNGKWLLIGGIIFSSIGVYQAIEFIVKLIK